MAALEPELYFVQCPAADGGHRMAYWSWGDVAASHVVVCTHGLSRQGRDFDTLARTLCARSSAPIRVVCPDVVGRGRSDWLKDPMGYQIPNYAADMLALLAELKPKTLDWVGTSMGGLIGMVLCGQLGLPLPVPVRRLVLNDVGPAIQWAVIERIGTYLGQTGRFATLEQAAAAMLAISAGFGPHTPQQWLDLSRHMVRPLADDAPSLTLHYDPAIAVPFRSITRESSIQGEARLWQLYDNIHARTLLLRGADSDTLSVATADAMAQRGPRAQVVQFAGVGHAPTLVAADQIDCVAQFLLG
ncbi:MAG: alpha/beta hydrolase [Rhodoferax sp.]|nr:alpha/beta hydrolase [Rhodoferax sp.]